jgi:hypothetical protein
MTVQHCIDAIDKGFHAVTDKKKIGNLSKERGENPAAVKSTAANRPPGRAQKGTISSPGTIWN